MKELRRLLIGRERLKATKKSDGIIILNESEFHYINRVLRLKEGDLIALIDGFGNLWEALVRNSNSIQLKTNYETPKEYKAHSSPKICLAVVRPKRGFDELLRMSCEIGIDVIQPLRSDRQVHQLEDRILRWSGILREAVEQSERLWQPLLCETIYFQDWLSNLPKNSAFAIASPRIRNLPELKTWMDGLDKHIEQAWIAIGPEGGWTPEEEFAAVEAGFVRVQFGETILRTSTAAVVATQSMVFSRRNIIENIK